MPRQVSTNSNSPATQDCATLRGEVNLESIHALDDQIKEHEMTIIKLKRARNSLLNVFRLPSEILGDIFSRNVTWNAPGGLKGSRNFLFVCHHWFNVASRTPEVWRCWGDTPGEWKKWCFRYPSAPLDLTLHGTRVRRTTFNNNLQNALRDRTAKGNVRSIHLISEDSELLGSVISSLTPNCEVLPSDMRSITVSYEGMGSRVDVSEFLTHNRFSKLRSLTLRAVIISSWDPIISMSQKSNFTTLVFNFNLPSPIPSMSHIRSILASNPTLRELSLNLHATPEDLSAGSSPLPLPHLRKLELVGDTRFIFGLLSQLDHLKNMDKFIIRSTRGVVGDIRKVVGPYLRQYLQHHGKPGGLGLLLSARSRIVFHVGDVGGMDFSAPEPEQMVKFLQVVLKFDPFPPKDVLMGAGLDLIAHIPREEVLYLEVNGEPTPMQDASILLPNLRAIHFYSSSLQAAFPVPTSNQNADIYPSLQHLTLHYRMSTNDQDWSPIIAFLRRRMDSGNRLDTLRISGGGGMVSRMSLDVEGLVREYDWRR